MPFKFAVIASFGDEQDFLYGKPNGYFTIDFDNARHVFPGAYTLIRVLCDCRHVMG